MFIYTLKLSNVLSPGVYYLATFGEPLLLKWVGLETTVSRRIAASFDLQVNAVEGNNPYTSQHRSVFHHCIVPPPIRKQKPAFVHHFTTEDKINNGLPVHHRVYKDYSVELKVSGHCNLKSPVVVLKVQTPKLVGGLTDHFMWDKDKYLEIEGNKTRKYCPGFLEYKKWMKNSNS